MDYDKLKIKEYKYWDLFLHERQYPYIGRCYASAKRKEADLVVDMNEEESEELFFHVIPQWNNAVKKLFNCSRSNVSCLGNSWNHLHWHLIPRYSSPRNFYGIEFIDPNPSGNYSPYDKKEIKEDILLKIKQDILKELK
jgi:diadenosine tetraphosphate (Ap4A) HIT family hydrolase